MSQPWDVIIVGQGLAGSTLAWHLWEANQRVLLIDAEAPVTSSKIAAGLITPITGGRIALSWRLEEFLPVAKQFYARVETHTGQKLLHARTALRLFRTDEERQQWPRRHLQPAFNTHLIEPQPTPLLTPSLGDASGGGFEMHAAQLDVPMYLTATRAKLRYAPMTLDWSRDVSFSGDEVAVREHRTRWLVSCEGFAAAQNPFFSWVPFRAAKGDILTVRFDRPLPPRTIHRGIWIAPTADPTVFRVGATYHRSSLDNVPTATAREEIEQKLQSFFHVPYTILEHRAAVRPIIQASKALIGRHPHHAQLGYFNGLGSKGSLHAPWYAQHLADFLVRGAPIPETADLQKHI